jgi:hypothetical protein
MSQPTGTQSGTAGTDPTQSGGVQDGGQGQGTQEGSQTQDEGAQSGTDPQAGQQTGQAVSREDFERIQNQLRAADQKRAEAERKLTEAERAKMDETERTKAELKDAQEALKSAQDLIKQQSLQLAFLKDNTYKWKDSDAALKLADLSEVKINEDGTVDNMPKALKKLAESKKYLLEEESSSDGGQQSKGTTGRAPGGQQGQGSDRAALEKRFPALRGRV